MRDKDWLLDQLREVMAGFPGVEFAFTQPIEMRTSEMLTGSRGDLAIKIFGPDLAHPFRSRRPHQGDAVKSARARRKW